MLSGGSRAPDRRRMRCATTDRRASKPATDRPGSIPPPAGQEPDSAVPWLLIRLGHHGHGQGTYCREGTRALSAPGTDSRQSAHGNRLRTTKVGVKRARTIRTWLRSGYCSGCPRRAVPVSQAGLYQENRSTDGSLPIGPVHHWVVHRRQRLLAPPSRRRPSPPGSVWSPLGRPRRNKGRRIPGYDSPTPLRSDNHPPNRLPRQALERAPNIEPPPPQDQVAV